MRYKRTYTAEERKAALHMLATCGSSLRDTARLCDVPWTTLREWSQQEAATSRDNKQTSQPQGIPSTREPILTGNGEGARYAYSRNARLHAIDKRIDLLVEAIQPDRIEQASLPHIAAALGTLMVRAEAIRPQMTPEEVIQEIHTTQDRLTEVLCRHIASPDLLAAILTDMDDIRVAACQESEAHDLAATCDLAGGRMGE